MNHAEAIETNTAEGYLLGDMSAAERDAFEEHSFDCSVCSDTLRAGAAMFAAGREVVKRPAGKVVPFRPMKWITANLAAAVLAVVVGVQGVALWMSRPPIMVVATSGAHIEGTQRSGEPTKVHRIRFQGDRLAEITVPVPPDPSMTKYRIELRDSSEKVLTVFDEPAATVNNENEDYLKLLLNPLPAGSYVLVIEGVRKGGNRTPVIKSNIVVE